MFVYKTLHKNRSFSAVQNSVNLKKKNKRNSKSHISRATKTTPLVDIKSF